MFRNQHVSLVKDPEFLYLFIFISVYTEYMVHMKSGKKKHLKRHCKEVMLKQATA